MNYFVYVKELLGIKTNTKQFSWVYGSEAPEAMEADFEKCKIKVHLEIRKTKDVFENGFRPSDFDRYNHYYAQKFANKVYYDRNFFLNTKLRYFLQIDGNDVKMVVNEHYFKRIKFRFMNLHSIGFMLTDIVSGLLLNNGYATLHCSCVQVNGKTIAIFAPPGMGKTFTAINLCKNDNSSFLAEDIALTDGLNVLSVPWTSTYRFYDHENETRFDKALNSVKNKLPIIELVSVKKRKTAREYLGESSMIDFAALSDVIILGRGPQKVVKDEAGVFDSILNLNKYEFNYHRSPTMLVMNYFNPEFSTDDMYENEKKIVQQMLNHSRSYRVFAESAVEYADIINRI
jgi:hypothetical protein